jgi:ATP-binding cassette subfamily F protein 3
LPALQGELQLGTNVKPGYYAQSHEQLRGKHNGTPLSAILDTGPLSEEYARTYLGRFLFTGDDVYKLISSLSGGERSRLALAVLLLEQANLLILDEPTNHLDIHSRETLETMLSDFDGTILFVSHDRFFMDRIATKLWIVQDESITIALGNYSEYQRSLGRRPIEPPQELRAAAPEPEKPEPVAHGDLEGTGPVIVTSKGKPRRRSDAETQKAVGQAERDISRLEGRLNEISDALVVASIDEDISAISRLGEEHERIQGELDDAYATWESVTQVIGAAV